MSTYGYGLCECGCGGRTSIAKQTETKRGYVKGEPMRFLPSHHGAAITNWRFDDLAQLPFDQCWEWPGPRNEGGYGKARNTLAHRVAYERWVRPIPSGLLVLHHCDNPPCCNPAHLWLGTDADNMADMARKARSTRGRSLWRRLDLTTADAAAIRARYAAGGMSQQALADAYGLSQSQVSNIIRDHVLWTSASGGEW